MTDTSEQLAKIYGYTPARRAGDAGGAVRSMTDISEQLGGHTQPVLRTVRERLWIDPEVVARVQEAMVRHKGCALEQGITSCTLRLSDVQAMLRHARAVPRPAGGGADAAVVPAVAGGNGRGVRPAVHAPAAPELHGTGARTRDD